CSLDYINKDDIQKLVSESFDILHIEESLDTIYFNEPLEVLKHLKKTGVNSLSKNWLWTKGSLSKFIEEYTSRFSVNNTFPLTYHPVYLVCRKKSKN
ncbi:MAG: malonyl-[acyl-carrier protein] O-methyltransferase BioC, partial [Odoribacter sp.]|nr:malonyl-[acyl-carrier protein] O-methyltransferase BioC [Odoribacter sp.]